MRRVLRSAAGAAVITAIPMVAAWWAMGKVAVPAWISALLFAAELPMWPGVYLAAFLGIRGGPDGMPGIPAMFVATFVVWWVFIEVVLWGWSRVRDTPPRQA